jgi:hypothetical protein
MLITGAASSLKSAKAAFQLGRGCLQKRHLLSCKGTVQQAGMTQGSQADKRDMNAGDVSDGLMVVQASSVAVLGACSAIA